jgi:hypothetical protein
MKSQVALTSENQCLFLNILTEEDMREFLYIFPKMRGQVGLLSLQLLQLSYNWNLHDSNSRQILWWVARCRSVVRACGYLLT